MLRTALAQIQKLQPEMIETFRKYGIVFTGPLGVDAQQLGARRVLGLHPALRGRVHRLRCPSRRELV